MFWERGGVFAAPSTPREPNVGFEIMDSVAVGDFLRGRLDVRKKEIKTVRFLKYATSCFMVGARLRHISTTKWGTRQYMNTCKLYEVGVR